MAGYQFLASEPSLQVISPELTQDAQRITARAASSGVVYSLLFAPYPTGPTGNVVWTSAAIAQQLGEWAGNWDQNAAHPGVVSIGVTSEVDAAGQLRDIALVTVQSDSGRSTTLLQLQARDFFPDTFAAKVDQVRAQLNADEAGS